MRRTTRQIYRPGNQLFTFFHCAPPRRPRPIQAGFSKLAGSEAIRAPGSNTSTTNEGQRTAPLPEPSRTIGWYGIYLGLTADVTDFGRWLRLNTDRDHFFVDASQSKHRVVALLEVYLKAVLGPLFEGSLKDHLSASEQQSYPDLCVITDG